MLWLKHFSSLGGKWDGNQVKTWVVSDILPEGDFVETTPVTTWGHLRDQYRNSCGLAITSFFSPVGMTTSGPKVSVPSSGKVVSPFLTVHTCSVYIYVTLGHACVDGVVEHVHALCSEKATLIIDA